VKPPPLWKLWLVIVVVTVTNPVGNLLIKRGLDTGLAVLALGVALLTGWTVLRMKLLRWADLSYVAPVTSLGYVITALLGRFVLGEAVSARRWAATALVAAGAALVAATRPSSEESA
jgi:drug/metabolite transporter (DMT)-like permease